MLFHQILAGNRKRIKRISGKHVVTIYYDPSQQMPAFLSGLMEEQYETEGNQSVGFKGFILTWFDAIILMDSTRLAFPLRFFPQRERSRVVLNSLPDRVIRRLDLEII